MRINHVENITPAKWEEMVKNHDEPYFFYTPAWAKILEETYDYKNASRIYHVGDNEIFLPLMKKEKYGLTVYSSMPYGYGNIFARDLSPGVINEILCDLITPRVIFLDLQLPPFSTIDVKKNLVIQKDMLYTHLINLAGGFEKVQKGFDRETRRQLRKAENHEVNVVEGDSLDDFRIFYDMLKTESVEKWGYREPPYPLSLFENLYKYAKGTVRLKLAVKDEKVIAGLINIFYGNSVFALFSSYRDEYRSFSPTRLLFKHSFQQACNDNYRYFNLGFSENLNKVSSFKDTLGGEKYPVARYRIGSYLGKAVNRIICLAR